MLPLLGISLIHGIVPSRGANGVTPAQRRGMGSTVTAVVVATPKTAAYLSAAQLRHRLCAWLLSMRPAPCMGPCAPTERTVLSITQCCATGCEHRDPPLQRTPGIRRLLEPRHIDAHAEIVIPVDKDVENVDSVIW